MGRDVTFSLLTKRAQRIRESVDRQVPLLHISAGSIIVDKTQPIEYEEIFGGQNYTNDEAMIIHLLMVRPSMAGKGIASSLSLPWSCQGKIHVKC